MKLRPKKKNCDEDAEADERGQKKRKGMDVKKASRGSPALVPGSSPAKKPRTQRPRAPGNKPPMPRFLLDPQKQKNGSPTESHSQAHDDENSDDYDFNNVVKAVALTLAEASQNGSGSNTPGNGGEEENDKEQETSDDEVGNEPEKPPPAPKPRRAADPPERRPPSERIRDQKEKEREKESEREREKEDEEEEPEYSRPQKRVQPQRSKKRSRQLFSTEEASGLDTLATLADLSLSGLLDSESERGGDGAPGALQELVSQVERPAKKQTEVKEHNTRSKQQQTSPKKKKRTTTTGKNPVDEKALPYVYKPTKRVSTTKNKQSKPEEEGSKKTKNAQQNRARCSHTTPELGTSSTKARLFHCLGSGRETEEHNVRQWCIYEWFYSAIDLPWFSMNEFVAYLHHAGLGHVSKLTRVEWGVIRNSLGKPRRLSQKFLQGERQKLAAYRERVRRYYDDHRNDKFESLPSDLPRPLTVGQRVIARHPGTGEISDGSILTVDRSRFRVQFDRTDLGVEFVQDIDTMPVSPFENMSEMMRKARIVDSTGKFSSAHLSERLDRPGHTYASPSQYFLSTLFHRAQMDNVDSVLLAKAAASEAASAVQHGEEGQERESDICALADLTRQLDKKEALLVELRRMNDEADKAAGESEPPGSSEVFKRQYATVVLQLKEVNKQVAAAVLHLRQRNKYKENQVPPWHSPPPCPVDPAINGLGAGSPAEEITLTARKDASSLVSATVQAICCLREGESNSSRLGKTQHKCEGQAAGLGATSNTQEQQGSDKADSCSSLQPAGGSEEQRPRLREDSLTAAFSSTMKGFIPKDYIASCVATVLMIQMCAERYQLPQSDVAVMFENALASLRPQSAQNHQLYKEVEQLFDVLKNQVTAEVSFRPSVPLPVDCFK